MNSLCVFGGPSLRLLSAWHRERILVLPPARQGDLLAFSRSRDGPGRILLVDGVFGRSLAVTPRECIEVMQGGWRLYGCSSMGALRAADLYAQGMVGLGRVYAALRSGCFFHEADLAVVFGWDGDRELTVSGVALKSLMFEAVKAGELSADFAVQALVEARKVHWSERTWSTLEQHWQASGLERAMLDCLLSLRQRGDRNPKALDALEAVDSLLEAMWMHPEAERTMLDGAIHYTPRSADRAVSNQHET